MKKLLKRTVALLTALAMVFGTNIVFGSADSITNGKCGNAAAWQYNKETKELIISGAGTVTKPDDVSVFDDAVTLIIKKGIKVIGRNAFENANFSNVVLEEGLEKIESYAFYGCDKIRQITIPKTVNFIGGGAFGENKALVKFTILGNITTGKLIFDNMYIPKTVELAGKYDNIAKVAASFDARMPEVVLINNNKNYKITDGMILSADEKTLIAYNGNATNTNIVIPNTITKIMPYAFYMRDIEKVTLNKRLQDIGEYAFYNCGIKKVTIPKNTIEIGEGAFAKNNISKITFNRKIKKIGKDSFADNNIKKVVLYNNPKIYKGAFDKNVQLEYKAKGKLQSSLAETKVVVKKKNTDISIKMNSVKGAKGYQVVITQPKMKKSIKLNTKKNRINKKTTLKVKYSTDSLGRKTVNKNSKVYVKIRPYKIVNNKKLYGKWSIKYHITESIIVK